MLCLLSALSLHSWLVVFEICLYSRFKGVFGAVWGCCVGLCCLRALRGLWGFCTRVELGGFMACGVFASVFVFFAPVFLFFAFLFISLPAFCPFVLLPSGCLCVFFFPYGWAYKKKGRNFLRPLFVCCGVFISP